MSRILWAEPDKADDERRRLATATAFMGRELTDEERRAALDQNRVLIRATRGIGKTGVACVQGSHGASGGGDSVDRAGEEVKHSHSVVQQSLHRVLHRGLRAPAMYLPERVG